MSFFKITTKYRIITVLFFNFIFFSIITINAAPGNIDRSFGVNGTVKTIFPSFNEKSSSTFQPDGKLLIVGQGGSAPFFDFYISRFNIDGSFDNSFGSNGTAIIPVSTNLDTATRAVVQPDGKIIVVGYTRNASSFYDFAIVRLNSNGTPDTTFGNNGIVITSTSNFDDFAHDAIIQPDNKIVIIGQGAGTNGQNVTVARYNSNGSLDVTFDGDGIAVAEFTEGISVAAKGLLQPDGKIVAAGGTADGATFMNFTFGLARFNSNGSMDTSFGGDGTVTFDVRNSAAKQNNITDILQQPDGKIVAVGLTNGGTTNNFDFAVARLNTDGSIDNSFGDAGKVITAIPGGNNDGANTVIRQTDGKLLIGGVGNADFTLIRLNPDGTYDTRFGNNGIAIVVDSTYGQGISSLRFLEDGKIAAAGFSDFETAFVKYLVNGSREADFDSDKKTDVAIYRPSTGAWWISRSANNQVYAVGFGASTDKIVPADFTGDGKTDIALFRESSGQWFILRSEDNTFYGFPFGAAGDKAVPADFDGDGKADPTVFRSSNSGWYSILSSNGSVLSRAFGVAEDVPLPNDYDGDGKADLGVFRPSTSAWWIQRSSNNSVLAAQFGATGDKPVPADFTGDGKTDFAFFRPSSGQWFILRSEDFSFYGFPFGAGTDTPVVGDYDGDGKADAAVFRDSNSGWYLQRSTAGFIALTFGTTGDKPVPSAYLP